MYDYPTYGNDLEVQGDWWLPGHSRKKVKGSLKISVSDGSRLRLMGQLPRTTGKPLIIPGVPHTHEVINGITTKGIRMSLVDCRVTHYALSGNETEYIADEVIADWHAKAKKQVSFHKVAISFTDFEEWLDIKQMDIKASFSNGAYNIASREPFLKEYEINGNSKIQIYSECYIKELLAVQTSASLIQSAQFIIQGKKEQPFEIFRDMVNKIRTLLCFANQAAVYPEKITGYSKRNTGSSPTGGTYEIPMDIYFRQMERLPKTEKDSRRYILFSFRQIEDYFAQVINNVLSKYDVLGPLFESYLPWYYLKKTYFEYRFLALVIGLERFHRMKYGGCELPETQHKARLDEIMSGVSKEHLKWLKDKLQYSNELTLRKRLREILQKYHNVLVGLYGDSDKLVQRTVETRNHLVHGGNDAEYVARTGEERWALLYGLETIIDGCLMCELGIPNSRARQLLSESRKLVRV